MCLAVLILSLMLQPVSLSDSSCVYWPAKTVATYRDRLSDDNSKDPLDLRGLYKMPCGTNVNPSCKLSANYVTIDADRHGAEFGDANYDTNDVDVELSCSFKPIIEGNYTIAIVSAENGDIDRSLNKFNKGLDADMQNVTIVVEKRQYVQKLGLMNTSVIVVSNQLMHGTKYACFCPHFTNVIKDDIYLAYKHAKERVENKFSYSSSFYQVPSYVPCEEQRCNEENTMKLEHCYQSKTGKELYHMNTKEIQSLLSYCEVNTSRGIRNNWVTESWTPYLKNMLINNETNLFRYDQRRLRRIITSKAIAQHVCTLMPDVEQWLNVDDINDGQLATEKLVHEVTHNMRVNPHFPWHRPDGEEIGSLMLLKGYTKLVNNIHSEILRKAMKHIRCTQHIELLSSMTKTQSRTYKVRKFYAKTYPGCVDTLEPKWEQRSFELLFNDQPAYYNTKHVSFGVNDDILVLEMPQQNSTVENDESKAKYEYYKIDCSLYIWNISEGIKSYHREQLYLQKSYDYNSRLVFKYNIPKNQTEKYSEMHRILVGCYIKYVFHYPKQFPPVLKVTRLKKMQFYVKPERLMLVAQYSKEKQLSGCKITNHTYTGEKILHANGTCECIMKISHCSPVKTTHLLRKIFSCYKGKPREKSNVQPKKSSTSAPSNTGLIIAVALIASLIFILGVILTTLFFTRKAKTTKAKPEVRILTLIDSNTSHSEGSQFSGSESSQYFTTDDTIENIPPSERSSGEERQSENQPANHKVDVKA